MKLLLLVFSIFVLAGCGAPPQQGPMTLEEQWKHVDVGSDNFVQREPYDPKRPLEFRLTMNQVAGPDFDRARLMKTAESAYRALAKVDKKTIVLASDKTGKLLVKASARGVEKAGDRD